ncbi:Ig-like domain-containing protein [Longispora sp. K20-0274]
MTRRSGILTLALAAVLALPACGSGGKTTGTSPTTAGPSASASPSKSPVPFTLAVTPAPNSTGLPLSTEVGTAVTGGRVTAVDVVTGGGGGKVAGALRADGTGWVPAKPLTPDASYTATVTATGDDGKTETRATTFTTMGRPGNRVGTGMYLFQGGTYGVAMPVVVEFVDFQVPEAERAAVARRLFVTSDPPQVGAWHWFGGNQVMYRPKEYWKPGTKITVRTGLDGHPLGNGKYGDQERSATVTIDAASRVLEVDNATKQMVAKKDGQVVRTMRVSLGKTSTPSSSGNLVVMDKLDKTIFDSSTYGVPANSPDGYRSEIHYAQRLTWSGEFIHAAPWSVGDQGVRNVSHGCVNVSWEDAEWVFAFTTIGDPVVIKGTERKVTAGNGWTAWDLTWEEFTQGA